MPESIRSCWSRAWLGIGLGIGLGRVRVRIGIRVRGRVIVRVWR